MGLGIGLVVVGSKKRKMKAFWNAADA